ncbi:MAG: crotonase/enoyl-CoA hydratase family protein [Actinomycetota bacterium]
MDQRRITVEHRHEVGIIWLDRPEKLNALSTEMWTAIPAAAASLDADHTVRAVVVAGRGDAFTVGIDLAMLASISPAGASEAERRQALFRRIKELQRTFNSLADCRKPVIAAVHGYCLGAGIDLITACDIRLASADAIFGVRETRMGMVADVGTMQRLPAIVGPGHVAELVYTGDDVDSDRAARIGLVNHIYPDRESLIEGAMEMAGRIAAHTPLVVQGAKQVLRAGEGRSVEQGLDYIALWNAAFLQSDDLVEAMAAHVDKRMPNFTGR